MKNAAIVLLTMIVAGSAAAQIHRCTAADGRISYSDAPCNGAASNVVTNSPGASPSAKARDSQAPAPAAYTAAQNEVRRVIDSSQQAPKSVANRVKKRECDAGNATACKEWEAMERAELKAFDDKLAPAAKSLGQAAISACVAGNQSACKSSCPEAHAHGGRFDPQFLTSCARVLGRESGAYWQVVSSDAMSHSPVERKYAIRMPKGAVLQEDLWVACYRKRVGATEVELASWSIKHAVNVDNDTGVKSGHKYSTIGQYGGFQRNESNVNYSSLHEWANGHCTQ